MASHRSRFDPDFTRKRRTLDPIKLMIAQAVQYHLISDPKARPPLMPQPEEVESMVAHAISETETTIRVVSYKGEGRNRYKSIRYFTVKVSEML